MNSASSIKRRRGALARRYRAGLRRHLVQGAKADLGLAERLGRQAVSLKLETLDLALIHEEAVLVETLPIHATAARLQLIRRAGGFFAAAILPMEETHRTALVTNVHLSRLNQSLSQRTRALTNSNRKLKGEIFRRKAMEHTLRQSEQRSALLLVQSQRLQDQLRHLSRRILSVQEEERKRVSRELHDVIAQVLAGINLRLAVLKTEATVNAKGLAGNIARTQRLVEKSVNIVHRFAYDLRPAALDYLGLIPALHTFMKSFTQQTGIRVRLTAFAGVEKLNISGRTTLYRVAQEALTNVVRHANASVVDVTIQDLSNAVRMQIKDNGKSFDVKQIWRARTSKHLGLLGMQERLEMVGGKFHVESVPGQGTTIDAQVPYRTAAKENK